MHFSVHADAGWKCNLLIKGFIWVFSQVLHLWYYDLLCTLFLGAFFLWLSSLFDSNVNLFAAGEEHFTICGSLEAQQISDTVTTLHAHLSLLPAGTAQMWLCKMSNDYPICWIIIHSHTQEAPMLGWIIEVTKWENSSFFLAHNWTTTNFMYKLITFAKMYANMLDTII